MQSAVAAGDGRIWRKEMQIFGRLAQNRDKDCLRLGTSRLEQAAHRNAD